MSIRTPAPHLARARSSGLEIVLHIRIELPPNQALILRIVLGSLLLEELDAALAQSQGDLYAFFAKDEVFGRRKEVRHYSELAQGLVGVCRAMVGLGPDWFDLRSHIALSRSAFRRLRRPSGGTWGGAMEIPRNLLPQHVAQYRFR